jgi:hypothetical protein
MSELGTYHGAPTMRNTLDWNRSRILMLEVEAVPQSCRLHLGWFMHQASAQQHTI